MLTANFTREEKINISNKIKNITIEQVNCEMDKLIKIGSEAHKMSPRCRIGNNIVDFFTFTQRLQTKGKYNVNYYEFIYNIDKFKGKKFIQNMIKYYETVKNKNKTKNEYIVFKEIYNICISSINIIRPLVYMEIYSKYNPSRILDFCAGWGGAAVAASALNIKKYIGIEINNSLIEPYKNLNNYLNTKSTTEIEIIFDNCLNIDYSKLDYDFVFTSPPYYFIQKYENNIEYNSKKEMNGLFYKPIFKMVYDGLKKEGYFIINVCKEVYEVILRELFGEAQEVYPTKKAKDKTVTMKLYMCGKKILNLLHPL